VPRSRFFLLSLLAAALWAGLAIPAASAVPVALAAPARLAMHASQAGAAVAPGPATPAVPGLRAASLAGTVLGASGQPVAHACVAATSSGAAFPALTDAAGRYRFTLPAPGTYTLTFSGCAAGRYRTEWSGGSLTAAGARPVRLTAGASVVVSPVHLESLSAQTAMPGPAGSLAAARATGAIVRAPAATASPPGISGVVRNAGKRRQSTEPTLIRPIAAQMKPPILPSPMRGRLSPACCDRVVDMRSRLHDPLRGEPYRRGFIVRNANRFTRVARTAIRANTDRDRLPKPSP